MSMLTVVAIASLGLAIISFFIFGLQVYLRRQQVRQTHTEMPVAYSAAKLVVENTARSFGFELQGPCPTFASWCASKRDP